MPPCVLLLTFSCLTVLSGIHHCSRRFVIRSRLREVAWLPASSVQQVWGNWGCKCRSAGMLVLVLEMHRSYAHCMANGQVFGSVQLAVCEFNDLPWLFQPSIGCIFTSASPRCLLSITQPRRARAVLAARVRESIVYHSYPTSVDGFLSYRSVAVGSLLTALKLLRCTDLPKAAAAFSFDQ